MKNNNSRTKNTILNFTSGVFGQFLVILMQFVVRTVFIKTLGENHLGISGLFSNILSMLSLAELGVGNAILFKLYDPLSKDNKERLKSLMYFYKKVYFVIAIVVAVVGFCIIPFLPLLINDYSSLDSLGINAVFIYILYLIQSVSTYLFWAYKSAIVKADQKEYILNVVSYLTTFISSILQIIFLFLFRNFEVYVVVSILNTVIQNLVYGIIANKFYPYLQEKSFEKISSQEVKDIFKDCAAIFLYRLNGVVLKATDNIVISMFLGLSSVGLYSNYYIFYTTINTVFSKVFDSVTHSLGNLHTTNDVNHEYLIFKVVNFIAIVLGATAGIGIFTLSDLFIESWIGKDWIIAQPFALLLGIEVYTLVYRVFLSKYRNAMGLFQQAKYRPLFGMIINLILSVVLVKYIGIYGVLIGTIVADWLTIMWYEPLIIHKHGFKNNYSVIGYYFKNISYLVLAVLLGFILRFIINTFLLGYGWLTIIVSGIICCIVVPFVYFVLFFSTKENKYVWDKVKNILNKIIKKIKK